MKRYKEVKVWVALDEEEDLLEEDTIGSEVVAAYFTRRPARKRLPKGCTVRPARLIVDMQGKG